jgi:hypothetical protein
LVEVFFSMDELDKLQVSQQRSVARAPIMQSLLPRRCLETQRAAEDMQDISGLFGY